MAYSILGKISRDSNEFDHIIDPLILSMNVNINPQEVLDKLSELAKHKNTKNNFQKSIKTEDSAALLTDSSSFPYKLTYVCRNGKHNPKNTTHKPESCWAEHPELRPPPRNKSKKRTNDAETHQTGLEALFTTKHNKTPNTPLSLVIDCGATHHMFNNKEIFTELASNHNEVIATSDPSSNLICEGRGTVKIVINNKIFTLKDCLYVPKLARNLVSLLDLCHKSITITKDGPSFHLSQNNTNVISGHLINKLMIVPFNQPLANLTESNSSIIWHQRLGHPGNSIMKSLGLEPPSKDICDICVKGKMTALPFKSHFEKTMDQHTSYKITCFMKNKSEVFEHFVTQMNLMQNLHDRKIKKIVTDGGGEFVNTQFKTLANHQGFIHCIAPPYTPQQNGFAERANRTLLDKARCLLLTSNLPNCYWAEAVNTATSLSNAVPTPSRYNQSPHLLWTGTPSKIRRLRTFGCKVIFAVPSQKQTWKLAPVGEVGILLGSSNNSAYRILKISDKKVYVTRHVVFFENTFPCLRDNPDPSSDVSGDWNNFTVMEEDQFYDCIEESEDTMSEAMEPVDLSNKDKNLDSSDEENVDPTLENESEAPPPRKRIKVIGPRHPTLINSNISQENILPYARRSAAHLTHMDPTSYNEAMKSASSELWHKAIGKELQNMCHLKVWEEVPISKETKLIGTTWVFKTKRNENNMIIEHKAHLCAQGFSQTPGVDFSKTFAPTGRLNSLRTLISFAASRGLFFEQLDIKSAFLNATLEENVYLSIPQGLDRDKSKTCLKLNKAIYGLRQAPLAWYRRLSAWLIGYGFNISKADSCVFHLAGEDPIWLFLHVDDIGNFGKNLTKFKNAIE
ncbi:hypothetical protein O181_088804 [Austropuccinia psidii MF-1]|uniref:Integrase catalytic domain-containing protein n=1 Tax=Austropuccinia psidii MF-1 TaxID=1389203 RepID=A0A9Q3ISB6_9BASI|nr:hypothetical protein [Austropuccinia psidii MF-1]